jgi:hypothetical protein
MAKRGAYLKRCTANEALRVGGGRESRDALVEGANLGWALRRYWPLRPGVVLRPELFRLSRNRLTQFLARLACLRPIMDQKTVELYDAGGGPLQLIVCVW